MKFIPIYFLPLLLSPILTLYTDQSFLVSPTIIPSTPQIIGNQVPLGFSPKLQLSQRIYNTGCQCSMNIISSCPPCTSTPSNDIFQQIMALNNCECAPRLQCDPCPKLYQAIHEMALRQATFDLNTQNSLQMKAEEQARLYGEAQKFAMEMQQQEEKALEAAKLMNEAANKAEIARQHMLKANAKARELAESSLYAYSNGNRGFLSNNPPFTPYGNNNNNQLQWDPEQNQNQDQNGNSQENNSEEQAFSFKSEENHN